MHLFDPEFPPLYAGHGVKAPGVPLLAALDAIGRGDAGGGDIFWARAVDAARCAIVMEPDHDLAKALQIIPVAMVALGDAIGAIGPPNLGITYGWPGTVYANGGRVGEIGAVVPPLKGDRAVPPWLVLTMELSIKRDHDRVEPGDNVHETELWEEGAGDLDRTAILESFTRHLLAWLDTWETNGFRQIHELWMFRAADRGGFISISIGDEVLEGTFLGLDDAGGVLVKTGTAMSGMPISAAARTMELRS